VRWLVRIWRNWRVRHQRPINLALHAVGIPMTLVVIPFLWMAWWGTAALLFFGGYGLQFLGHALEGNDPGEVVLVKRLLGLPYTAIAPSPAAAIAQQPSEKSHRS